MEEKKLVMYFKTQKGDKISISVPDPKDDLTEEQIKNLMDTIIAKDIFKKKNFKLTEAIEAEVVETTTTGYDLIL